MQASPPMHAQAAQACATPRWQRRGRPQMQRPHRSAWELTRHAGAGRDSRTAHALGAALRRTKALPERPSLQRCSSLPAVPQTRRAASASPRPAPHVAAHPAPGEAATAPRALGALARCCQQRAPQTTATCAGPHYSAADAAARPGCVSGTAADGATAAVAAAASPVAQAGMRRIRRGRPMPRAAHAGRPAPPRLHGCQRRTSRGLRPRWRCHGRRLPAARPAWQAAAEPPLAAPLARPQDSRTSRSAAGGSYPAASRGPAGRQRS